MQQWFSELKRRRVFRAMAAYFVGAWLLLQIASVVFPPLGLPEWSQRVLIYALATGVVPAFVLAWIYDLTRGGIVRTAASTPPGDRRDAATSSEIDALLPVPSAKVIAEPPRSAAEGVASADAERGASIAVLPFADLSPAHDQDWFCDGLAEEIIDALCCVRRLRVASRTASFRFRDGSVDPREIGRLLQVGAILEGSVRKAGERARITAQLIDAATGYHLWSETYDRRLEDIFAIQSEIARKVSSALKLSLTGEDAERCERYAPRNVHAHEFYLRGRQLAGLTNGPAWRRAPAMFRRAIELDPDYAHAHAGLADMLAQLVLWRFESPQAMLPEAERAANRALELAPDLAETQIALGHVRAIKGDDQGATRAFERALELNPELPEASYYFARHLSTLGEAARAAELYIQAWNARPDDYTVLAMAVSPFDAIGADQRALEIAEQAREGLQRQVELDPDNARAHYLLAGVLARLGRAADGKPHIDAALRLRPDEFATLYNAACYYSLAGETERALELVDRAVRSGEGNLAWIEHDADLVALRPDPRFQALLAEQRARVAG